MIIDRVVLYFVISHVEYPEFLKIIETQKISSTFSESDGETSTSST